MAVEPYVGHAGTDALPQAVAQRREADVLVLQLAPPDLHGLAEAHDTGHVLGPRPAPAFVLAAVLHGLQLGALADPEARHALGPVDLVAGERQQVDAAGVDVELDLAEGLHGIDVERDAALARQRPDRRHRLDGARLAVGVHDRDADRVGLDRPLDLVRVHHAVFVDADVGDGEALRLQP